MKIVGCDLHARQQSIALLDRESGDFVERTLEHEPAQVREFYSKLGAPVVVGIEATSATTEPGHAAPAWSAYRKLSSVVDT